MFIQHATNQPHIFFTLIFFQITECAKNLQFKLSLKASDYISTEEKSEFHEALDKFTDWRKILSSSHISPEEVLSVLLRSGDFETAKLWCRHLNQPQQKYLVSSVVILHVHSFKCWTWKSCNELLTFYVILYENFCAKFMVFHTYFVRCFTHNFYEYTPFNFST